MNILIRCDANKRTGNGHFSRCLNIARGLLLNNNVKITFMGNFNAFALEQLQRFSFTLSQVQDEALWSPKDNLEVFEQFDLIVIDSYLYEADFIEGVIKNGLKLVVIDDFGLHQYNGVRLVINFCLGAENKYKYLSDEQLLGLQYFPYKLELKSIRQKKQNKGKWNVNNVLIAIGGVDLFGIGDKIAESLSKEYPQWSINLVSSESKVLLPTTINKISFNPQIEQLYENADLVIHGGGLTKYESAFCCIPNWSISQTEAIYADTLKLEQSHLTVNGGLASQFNESVFLNQLDGFLKNFNFDRFIKSSQTMFNVNALEVIAKKISSL